MPPSRGWDASSHEALLFAILDEVKPRKAFLMNVTERMKDMGYSYSFDAIKSVVLFFPSSHLLHPLSRVLHLVPNSR